MKLLKTFGLVLLGLAMANCTKEGVDDSTIQPSSNLLGSKIEFEQIYADHFMTLKEWNDHSNNREPVNVDQEAQFIQKVEDQSLAIGKKLQDLSLLMPREELKVYLQEKKGGHLGGNFESTPCYDAYEESFLNGLLDFLICGAAVENPAGCFINLANDVRRSLNDFNTCMNEKYPAH